MSNSFVREYKRIKTYSLNYIFPFIYYSRGRRKIKLGKYFIKINSLRLLTFKEKGIVCKHCGIQGKFFALEQVKDETPHLNLYGINEDKKEVLMTSDHIIPFSKSKNNSLENRQCLCVYCNAKKGDNYENVDG